jgi:hypothetical protein
MTKITDKTRQPEKDSTLSINFSALITRIDSEKVGYAIQGTVNDCKKIAEGCAERCGNCSEEQCTKTNNDVMSALLDSRIKYNLNDPDYLASGMIIIDKVYGLPAQPVSPVVNNSRLSPDETFGVDTEYLMSKAMDIYVDKYGDSPMVFDKDKIIGFDDLMLIIVNDLGCSYKQALSICLKYIHSLTDLLMTVTSRKNDQK